MAIKARLRGIESRIPVLECECRTPKMQYIVVHPGEPEPRADVCAKCGRIRPVIAVKYIERAIWDAIQERQFTPITTRPV